MIRAIRPAAMAQDDVAKVAGWNVAPNVAYVLRLLPGSSSCGVLLYDEDGSTLVATGAALVGTAQPCILIPQSGQTVGMVDADLGWHMLLTTIGTESQRTIRLGPAVDLPDEIHPVYGDDGMALARATAAIDQAAHYIDDVTVTCPLGLGAGLGDVVSVPVDGVAVVGQVESITWTATPDGTTEQAVIRRHVAIAPEPVAEITPPTVTDDTGAATHTTGTSGNVLSNDEAGLAVTAVNGLSANVGEAVDGDNGGVFTINADGSWTFSPDGDFALLEGSETADTSVTYHAFDGTAEAMATLTITVSHANAAPVAVDDSGETTADATTSGNVLSNDTDADEDTPTVSQVAGSAANVGVAVAGSSGGLFTIGSDGAWSFDPGGDFDSLTGEDTATTSVTYHVSDGVAEAMGTLTVTVIAAPSSGVHFIFDGSAYSAPLFNAVNFVFEVE
jgi:VCBS repeat-containing protein